MDLETNVPDWRLWASAGMPPLTTAIGIGLGLLVPAKTGPL